MGSALGSSARGGDRGSRVLDIRDFGARPNGGPAASTANRVAIQAAIDYAGATFGGSSTIYIPAGDWFVDRPMFIDSPGIRVVGEGIDVTRVRGQGGHDIFTIGVARKPLGKALTPGHLVDLFNGGSSSSPLLDSTAVSAPGQRWGLRTLADAHLAQVGGGLDAASGDYYVGVRQITIDAAVDFTNSPGTGLFPSSGCLFGLSSVGQAMPWYLIVSGGALKCAFRTQAPGIDQGVERSFTFGSLTGSPGLVRFTVQIDLINAQVLAWVNGVQVVVASSLGSDFLPESNLVFYENQSAPFCIGATAGGASTVVELFGSAIDTTFCGLKISSGPIYSNFGPGVPQTRADGQAITDFRRYFQFVSGQTIAYLPLNESPALVTADRVVTAIGNSAYGVTGTTLHFLDNVNHASTFSGVNQTVFRDLTLLCATFVWGQAISVGFATLVTVEDCNLQGGAHGLGCLPLGANYQISIENCTLAGNDACLYLNFSSSVRCRNIYLDRVYRAGIRLIESGVVGDGVFTSCNGTPDYIVKAERAWAELIHVSADNETFGQGPQIACFYASPSRDQPVKSQMILRDVAIVSTGPNASIIVLEAPGAEDGFQLGHCSFAMDGLVAIDFPKRSIVRVGSPRWQGTFRAEFAPMRPYWVESTAGTSNVQAIHHYFTGPPRDGAWDRACHVLRISDPSPGQFSEWRCAASGVYGTATPPVWTGLAPMDDGVSLAAYVLDCSYWAISGSPAGSTGFWANGVLANVMNALLAGGAPTGGPPFYAGLCILASQRAALYGEPVGGGYARVAVPASSWTASSGGAATLTQPITFPKATADWTTANPILSLGFFTAASGGSQVAAVDVSPLNVRSGATPSFPAGALTIGRASASSQGNLSGYALDLMNNYWLKGQAIAPPSIYLALSTAAANPAAPPSEPIGGGYARVAAPASSWTPAPNATLGAVGASASTATVRNATALTFPAPTAGWGTVRSVYLMDAPSGGNVLAAANLTIPRAVAAGDSARSFAPGALWICRS